MLSDKILIFKDNYNKSGIYRWINLDNGKSYVGSSVNFKEIFLSYYNLNHLKENYNMLICRALIKDGHSGFKLEILEYCAPEDLEDRENYSIDSINPEYNLVKKSNVMPSILGYKHSISTIEKISKAQPYP